MTSQFVEFFHTYNFLQIFTIPVLGNCIFKLFLSMTCQFTEFFHEPNFWRVFCHLAQPFCNSLSEAGLETGGQLEICWRRQSIPWWLILPITTSLSWFLQETNWPCGFLLSRDVCRVEDLGPNLR